MPMDVDYQAITVSGVQGILVSDIVQDTTVSPNVWVRKILVYDTNPSQANPQPILILTLTGATQAAVEIQTPQLEF